MTRTRLVQILLTVVSAEFFGPLLRDSNATHLLHPDWVGHARVHLVWLLGFMALSGLAVLYNIWLARPVSRQNLWFAWVWEACLTGGFWISVLTENLYGGELVTGETHVMILGVEENVLVFLILTALLALTGMLLARMQAPVAVGQP